jgi:hypothetical protein
MAWPAAQEWSEAQLFGGGDGGVGVEHLYPDEPQLLGAAEQAGPFGVASGQGQHRRIQVPGPAGAWTWNAARPWRRGSFGP